MTLTVEVWDDETGVLEFRGKPRPDTDDFLTITRQLNRPTQMTCMINDMSASIDRQRVVRFIVDHVVQWRLHYSSSGVRLTNFSETGEEEISTLVSVEYARGLEKLARSSSRRGSRFDVYQAS